jgi:hypothetical protein
MKSILERFKRSLASLLLAFSAAHCSAAPITTPAAFTSPTLVIDYRNAPTGLLPDGASITDQYSLWGVSHDGSTTTPPGPPGMSSPSGLPGLESFAGDADASLPITISFATPVRQVGAYYLMSLRSDSITLTAFRANSTIIESISVTPAEMPMRPGPFNYNEGFIGLIVNEPIAAIRFSPSTSPFVIDDVHFAIPEPSTFGLASLIGSPFFAIRRRSKNGA